MITITRKIQLIFDTNDKEVVKSNYETLYRWQRIVVKAANIIATTHFCLENIKDMFFLEDGTKKKIADAEKDENGILTTSKANSTYQLLSKKFKGEIPMSIMTSLNQTIVNTFNKEKKEYFNGARSLRSYRNNIPIPIRSPEIKNIVATEDKRNYHLLIHNIEFKTNFGRDLSGNKLIFQRSMLGEYKLCDSSIQLDGNKIFLLAVFAFEKETVKLNPDLIAEANLSIDIPIQVKIENKKFDIGNKEEFLHRRIAIQQALRRSQIGSRYNKGGKGRKKKMKSTEQFEKMEINYVTTRIHTYTHRLIDYCVKYGCGKILLKDQIAKEEEAKQDEMLLRNWSYFGMKEKIKYKAALKGIEIIEE